MKSHNVHCSDNQKDPDHQMTCQIFHAENSVFVNTRGLTATYGQSGNIRQQVGLWNFHFIHQDHACGRRPQGELSLNLGGWKAFHSTLQDKASHPTIITLSPHHCNVSHWGIGDPSGEKNSSVQKSLLKVLAFYFRILILDTFPPTGSRCLTLSSIFLFMSKSGLMVHKGGMICALFMTHTSFMMQIVTLK